MMAFLLLMLVTPIERTIVTTAASPSGIAATARLTATINTSSITPPFMSSALSRLTAKYYSADHKDQHSQYLAQLTQLYLERRLAFFGLSKSVGDLSHLGVHSCLAHHCHSSPVYYSTSHVDHISAVSQRYLF